MTVKELLRILQNYRYTAERLIETENRLENMQYKITPSYSGNPGGGRTNAVSNKVEDFATKLVRLNKTAEECRRQLRVAEATLYCPELSQMEKWLLDWIAAGGKVASFAEARGIYISRAYKIRDKALKKAIKHISGQQSG